MFAPTKVWKFEDVYDVKAVDISEVHLKVLINWQCGQKLFDRSVLDLKILVDEVDSQGWTFSACKHERSDGNVGISYCSVVHQFESLEEAQEFASECSRRLKEISELP